MLSEIEAKICQSHLVIGTQLPTTNLSYSHDFGEKNLEILDIVSYMNSYFHTLVFSQINILMHNYLNSFYVIVLAFEKIKA